MSMDLVKCCSIFILGLAPVLNAQEPQPLASGSDSREALSITVYQNNFAVVTDVRRMVLPAGLIELEFQDVARGMEASSVLIETDDNGFEVLEQDYRFDLLSRQTLLERYVGKQVKYSERVIDGSQPGNISREGTLLSASPEIVQFGDEIEIGPEGTLSLPYIPEGLSARPALLWLVESGARGSRTVRTSYITGGMRWLADHVLILNEKRGELDLNTWVSVENRSGLAYEDAALGLVAGNVSRIPDEVPEFARESSQRMAAGFSLPAESVHEYYLYRMPRKTTLANNETKQLHLLAASGVRFEKSYMLMSGVQPQASPAPADERAFDTIIRFVNDEDNSLGTPLPAGKARVYARDARGNLQFAGENRITHVPDGGRVAIVTGKAFDLLAERKQVGFRRTSDRSSDVSYEIAVRNHKDEPAVVIIRERLFGDWTILQQSHEGERVDSTTLDFRLELAPGEEQAIAYTARITRP